MHYLGLLIITTICEVLKDGITGVLDLSNIDQVVDKFVHLYNNKNVLDRMKKVCLKESGKYKSGVVMKSLTE